MRAIDAIALFVSGVTLMQASPAFSTAMCFRCNNFENRASCEPDLDNNFNVYLECKVMDAPVDPHFTVAQPPWEQACLMARACHLNDRAEGKKKWGRCGAAA